MIPDPPSARWLDRLDRLQRRYDGPIPAGERRWIFADPGPTARSAPAAWSALARDSAERIARLQRTIDAAPSPRERRAAGEALAEERTWLHHCRARAVVAAEAGREAAS
jgi:hypothetical protein